MKKSISVNKKSIGRPKKKGGVHPVSAVRLPPAMSDDVDAWAAKQGDKPGRSEAIRRLVEIGLKAKSPKGVRYEAQKNRAKEMAGGAIDKLTDHSAHPDDQANRKRRLLKGPEEFRDLRVVKHK